MGVGILATVVFCIAVTIIELLLLKSTYNTEASNSMETSSETIPTTTMTIPTIVASSDGSGTKNPGTGRIRAVLFRVLGGPGTRMNRTGRIRVK